MEGQFEAQAADHELGGFQESPKKCAMDTSQPTATPTSSCFDCNICLEFAVDPVVTLCGHLYCWPCIYKWLQLEGTTPPQCPVCKATFSQTTLVPLYGRGNNDSKGSYHYTGLNIPSRPSVQHRGQDTADSLIQPELQTRLVRRRQLQYHNNHNNYSSYGNMPTLRGTAVAVLPWVFGDHIDTGLYYSNPYYLVGSSNSPRLQRQEMHIKRSLHRISIFLLCCMLLCLLLF